MLQIKIKQMEKLKKALLEAAKWEEQLTEYERTKISFAEARQCVIDRIFENFKQDSKQNMEDLPNTEKIVSDLQNLQVTIDKLLLHIKNVEEENYKLKSELSNLYNIYTTIS